jgi:hypothetical protein
MRPDILDVDQDPDGADPDVLRAPGRESLAFDQADPDRAGGTGPRQGVRGGDAV